MQYLVSFLEGVITFISPCLLPMLPVYVSYFAGGGERSTKKTLTAALGFVLGFTAVFVAVKSARTSLTTAVKRRSASSGIFVVYTVPGSREVVPILIFDRNGSTLSIVNLVTEFAVS